MSSIHGKLGQEALSLLSEEERSFWGDECANIPEYCFYPDLHLASQWEAPEKEAFYMRYCALPGGRHCIPHGPVNANWRCASFGDIEISQDIIYKVLSYYIRRIVFFMRKGDIVESARFAGTTAHLVQDFCTPGHIVNNLLLNRLFPATERHNDFLHRVFDGFQLEDKPNLKKPCVLGRCTDEAAWRLGGILAKEAESIIPCIVHMCSAIRSGRISKKAARLVHSHQERAIELSASLWRTCFMLAWKRKVSAKAFETQSLIELPMLMECSRKYELAKYAAAGIPFYSNKYPDSDPPRSTFSTLPYHYEPAVGHLLDAKGRWLPERGDFVAVGSYGSATWLIPGGLFASLETRCRVNLEGNDAPFTFGIWCHETNSLLWHKTLSRKDGEHAVKVALPKKCRTISLLSAGPDAFGSSALWLNPKIISRI